VTTKSEVIDRLEDIRRRIVAAGGCATLDADRLLLFDVCVDDFGLRQELRRVERVGEKLLARRGLAEAW
jgi:hypothetical protein